jgi:hypothetical protein
MEYLEYEVQPGGNVPQGLPRQRLAVLSPVWQGPELTLVYPDEEVQVLVGWSGSNPGGPCNLRVFWTRTEPTAPAVALAIGGDAGVRSRPSDPEAEARGWPFVALADSLIPAEVRAVIGPRPTPAPQAPLLLV